MLEPLARVENLKLCSRCGGKCCKTSPGRFAPSDFQGSAEGLDTKKLKTFLEQGRASIVIGFVRAFSSPLAPIFMLKHRGKGKGELEFFCSDTECSALDAEGCSYSLELRPFECAAIVPRTSICVLPNDLQMEDLWSPHQITLYPLIHTLAGCDWVDEFHRQLDDTHNMSPFKQEVHARIKSHGLTTSVSEISLIADLVRSM